MFKSASIYGTDPVEQFKALLEIVNKEFDKERAEKLTTMYEFLQERIVEAPASGKEHMHLAYVGGYLDHVHNVIRNSLELTAAYKKSQGVIDFTRSEMIFAAMHHDLGKLGDLEEPYYIPETSDWHRKNQGSIFKHNPKLTYMTVPDRALYLLQHFDVKCTKNETLGIKLADGMYDEGNKVYLRSFNADHHLGSELSYILHWADHMSCRSEHVLYWTKKNEEKKKFSLLD